MASALLYCKCRKNVSAVVIGLLVFLHFGVENSLVSRSLNLGPVAGVTDNRTAESRKISQQYCGSSDPALLRRIQCMQSDLTAAPLSEESCEFLRTSQIPERWRDQLYYHDLPAEPSAAVCKPQESSRNWKFITFGGVTRSGKGSMKRIESAKVLRDKVSNLSNFDESFAFSLDDIDNTTMNEHQELFDDPRVFNMLAKPYLLHRTAHSYPEGTILVWLDSDIDFQENLDIFGCLAENSERGIVPIHASSYLEHWFTKRDLFLYMGMDENQRVMKTSQIQSGLLSLRVTKYTREFLSEWLRYCTQPQLFRGDVPSVSKEKQPFWRHREDQSILSLLVKRERIPSYPIPYTGRDRTDITSIVAGYCEEGVNTDVLVYNEWKQLKGLVLLEEFRQKLPGRKHLNWFYRLRSTYLRYWNHLNETESGTLENLSNVSSTMSPPTLVTPTEMSNNVNNSSGSIEKSLALCNISANAAASRRIQCVQSDLTAPLTEESCEFLRTARIPPRMRTQLVYHDLPADPNAARCKEPQRPRNWKFITFGDVVGSGERGIQRRASTKALRDKVDGLANFDESFAFSLDDIDNATLKQHHELFDHPRLFHMLAKPYLLNRTVHSYPEGTILVWMDSDIDFQHNLDLFGCLAENSETGIVPMHANSYLEMWFTKGDLFNRMGMDNDKNVSETTQIHTGLLSLRVTKYTRRLLSEWLSLCYQPQLFRGDVPSLSVERRPFWQHRSSQSILSLLVKREGIPSYPIPYTGRDRTDITSIVAGYCEEGVDADLLVYNEWQGLKGSEQLQGFRKKLPGRKHFGWFAQLESTYLRYWDLNETNIDTILQ